MTKHPNNMTTWPTIGCQRGCDTHYTRWVDINLARHGYADLTPIPPRFQHRFTMSVWDPKMHPVDGGAYCPAHDAVSETLVSHGVWEPRETVAALLSIERFTGAVVDMGAQLGWYSILGLIAGRNVVAFEADPLNAEALGESVDLNNLPADRLTIHHYRIDADTKVLPVMDVAFAKIDLEGAERDGVRILWPSIEASRVGAIMVEVSPVFDSYYPDLVCGLIESGYDAHLMPPKAHPPHVIRHLSDLPRLDGTTADIMTTVEGWHQEDVLFVRRDA